MLRTFTWLRLTTFTRIFRTLLRHAKVRIIILSPKPSIPPRIPILPVSTKIISMVKRPSRTPTMEITIEKSRTVYNAIMSLILPTSPYAFPFSSLSTVRSPPATLKGPTRLKRPSCRAFEIPSCPAFCLLVTISISSFSSKPCTCKGISAKQHTF